VPARAQACVDALIASQAEAQITSPVRAAMYLAEVAHESVDLTHLEENLSYSAERAAKVWPQRFPTAAAAAPYAHQPEKLANHVYCDRLGNGDEASGDGWKYRGRGGIMQTGFESYLRLERETGIPFTRKPELLALPEYAFLGAAKFWIWKGVNVFADAGDVKGATKRIQGAFEGLEQRQARFDLICPLVGALSLHLIS
jgi:putative chitinase